MTQAKTTKTMIGKIPIIGYLLRWILSLVKLPNHVRDIKNTLTDQKDYIASLKEGQIRSNEQILDLMDRIKKLEK